MTLSFRKIRIKFDDCFYRGKTGGDFQWVNVRVTLCDSRTDTYGEIKIPLATFLDGERSLDQLRNDALAEAIEALRSAASALEGRTYAELVEAHTEFDLG